MSRSPTAGNRNQGAKWIRKAKRQRIYLRDQHTCVWCTAQLNSSQCGVPTLDHVLPRSQGGTNDAHNLITACGICNSSRGDLTPLQFATKLAHGRTAYFTDRLKIIGAILGRVLDATEKQLPPARAEAQAAE